MENILHIINFLLTFLNDSHLRFLTDFLAVIIVVSRAIPAFRFMGLASQVLILFIKTTKLLLEITQHYLKTHPKGRQIAAETNIDERIKQLYQEEPTIG